MEEESSETEESKAASSSSAKLVEKRNLSRANTLPGWLRIAERLESSIGRRNLQRSITERRKQNTHPADLTAQLFDAKISVRMKHKMLNRIASVKDDGCVLVEVPSNVELASLEASSEDILDRAADEKPLDPMDIPCIPPLQIVILIVGTRGDVQPFVAIGKHLQVHHGGAGTTAAGLKAACPTTVVPFFGDQPFWCERVHARGLGPTPIPVSQFTLLKLVDAIKFMLDPEVKERAVEVAVAMKSEDGVAGAVAAFLKHLAPRLPRSETIPPPLTLPETFSGRAQRCFGCS